MKFLLTTALILTTNLAMAAAPKISCELNYGQNGAQGSFMHSSTLKVDKPYATQAVQINDFKLEVTLQPICAAGGPCSGLYELKTVISKNDISTYSTKVMNRKHDRQFIQLTVGDESAFANCDVQ